MKRIKNTFRTWFNIRVERTTPPPGPQPPVGSSIVRCFLRIRLKVPIDGEQWAWFSAQGWRTTDMRTDRRRYTCVQDRALLKLLDVNKRDRLHAQMLQWEEEYARPARDDAARTQGQRAHARARRPAQVIRPGPIKWSAVPS